MMAKSKRPPKLQDIMELVHDHLERGAYLDTYHAQERQEERFISRLEIIQVLEGGFHEKSKDKFQEQYRSWNYAIRGKTVDARNLRVVIAFEQDMLIITAIDLDV